MPVIKVEMFAGRTPERKRDLAQSLTDAFLNVCGGRPESVQVIFQDVSKGDWAIAGKLASELYPDAAPAVPKQST
jgi:4-oxalocrotonate tautomerase